MTIALIAAAAGKKMVIGKGNDLPWHFKADLQFFKNTTTGHAVLMGRKTYQSILNRLGKSLPGRQSIVLTRDKNFTDARAMIIHNASDIKKFNDPEKTLFIIGGAEIFDQTIHLADIIYLTYIDKEYEGDTFFPAIDPAIWKLSKEEIASENGVMLHFCTYKKIQNTPST